MYGDIIDYLIFEYNTTAKWPFAVPYERITLYDLERIGHRLEAIDYQSEWGSEPIYGACIEVLGER